MLEDDDVEIIHSTNTIDNQSEHQQNLEFIQNLNIQHQKLLSSNKSLENEVQQYKGLLDQTIETLRQSQKDENILKYQLSQKQTFIQVHQMNSNQPQNITNIATLIKLKDSNSNKDSLDNKYTNVSSNYGYINSSLSSHHTDPYEMFISQAQILNQSIKKVQSLFKQNECSSFELQKLIQEFEENINVFAAINDQFIFEIHRTIVDQNEQKKELQKQSISSNNQHSQQEQQTEIFKEDLETSQFENEVQIKQQFEQFELSLIKISEDEKKQWKEQLLQLINTL
ncbi:unnamed protein product [Paramecium pentaurelia]|uniref:Uncharacterized protein n=1 Tax=Paramecium pentaurelia TaxID=43138 RepID=A0A8S1Y9G0_9CILI|nr:unnamed protein product [Paramecium pentaurelia]